MNWRCQRLRGQFEEALACPRLAQEAVLRKVLTLANRESLPETPTSYLDYPEHRSWTSEPIRFFESTSGSGAQKKAIPYTKSLLRSFERMFLLWSHDLLRENAFNLQSGKTFLSISPKLKCLGMSSDTEYLSFPLRLLLSPFLLNPKDLVGVEDGLRFRHKLREHLFSRSDLEVISIWSPSYLLALLEGVNEPQHLWPNLKLISCWSDGPSQESFLTLKRLFPNVSFQSKGLLATEAPMTIPWLTAGGAVPLWPEVYLEYLDSQQRVQPLWNIQEGEVGELLVSTQGGLVRYRIGDHIVCSKKYKGSPVIEFQGRGHQVSDLVGEKLDEELVLQLLRPELLQREIVNWSLLPDVSAHWQARYVLVTDKAISADLVESALRKSHHYALARELNQLAPARVEVVPDLRRRGIEFWEACGIKWGDQKERRLWNDRQRAHEFLDGLRKPIAPSPILVAVERPSVAQSLQ